MWTPTFLKLRWHLLFHSPPELLSVKEKKKLNQTKPQIHASFSTFALMIDSFPPLLG